MSSGGETDKLVTVTYTNYKKRKSLEQCDSNSIPCKELQTFTMDKDGIGAGDATSAGGGKGGNDVEPAGALEASRQAAALLAKGGERETWSKKVDFLLSVIGFAVDLGNVWRFPYICYTNGGGAFLIPYVVMLVFGGLPLFYMELALGQYQKCGCITLWKRICPMFKGIGFGICIIASYIAMYYNTIIAWSVYFLVSSFDSEVPWARCGHEWNTPNCFDEAMAKAARLNATEGDLFYYGEYNGTIPPVGLRPVQTNLSTSAAQEFFERRVLAKHLSTGIADVGGIKWSIAACLAFVFVLVYFSLWKGIKGSGKAVWITATLPYIILFILLCRGLTLDGAKEGILYYLSPQWEKLLDVSVWVAAAAQIFFSLGPGFGVLLALSSYNKLNNNCYTDALATAVINCATSFLAGFVVFSVLGYMAKAKGVSVDQVAAKESGLVFVVYPEAIATLTGSVFWAIIFFLMLITLGLDSTFGGLEAIITGICDEWPQVRKKRELFVLGLIIYIFVGALATTTYGGQYVLNLLDAHAAPTAIIFVCFLECIAVSWFYGVDRFANDIQEMIGFRPGMFWIICWKFISPIFLMTLFILAVVKYEALPDFPEWATAIGWLTTCSSLICVPIYLVYRLAKSRGTAMQRLRYMIAPEELPIHRRQMVPVYL